jgi:CubicO group peptidase (beta-lactamase class C family)
VSTLADQVESLARETSFSGIVRVDHGTDTRLLGAYGFADRAFGTPITPDTQMAVASGTKGLTALVVMSLAESGAIDLEAPVRPILGDDLPLIDDAVTVRQLLAHRSGIGDYLDEDLDLDVVDYVLSRPVQELVETEDYVAVLDGFAQKFVPGSRFSYCNAGYVVLALVAERVTRVPFHLLVQERVCQPARMARTRFLRSDELDADVARGYLTEQGLRTNVFHLPVLGSGDGGIYTVVADVHAFWRALFAGQLVSTETVTQMTRSHSDARDGARYGLGFWLHAVRDTVSLVGSDAGVSFRSVHDPDTGITHTVVSNTEAGAWPITRLLDAQLLP